MGEYRLESGLPRLMRIQLVVMGLIAGVSGVAAVVSWQRWGSGVAACSAGGVALGGLIFLGAAGWEIRGRRGFTLTVDATGIACHNDTRRERRLASYEIATVQGGNQNRGLIVRAGGDLKAIHIPPGVENFPALRAELTALSFVPRPLRVAQHFNLLLALALWVPIIIEASPGIRIVIDLALLGLVAAVSLRLGLRKTKLSGMLPYAALLGLDLAVDAGAPAWFSALAGTLLGLGLAYIVVRALVRWWRNPSRPRSGAGLIGPGIGLVVCVGIGFLLHTYWIATIRARSMIGRAAPDLRLVTAAGQPVALADYRGRPLVVGFWASWCEPCERESPILSAWYSEQRRKGTAFNFLAIDDGEDQATVRAWLVEHPVPYGVALDAEEKGRAAFHIGGIPTVFVVDAQGKIVFASAGFSAGIGRELTAALRR